MLDRVTHRAARSCSAQGAASGAVDNPTSARHHLTNAFYCPNKPHHFFAHDAAGNAGVSTTISVNVANATAPVAADTTPPVVAITNPTASMVSGNVTVSVQASDNSGAAGISLKLYIDGTLKASGTGSSLAYTWNTRKISSGSHTVQAVAKDAAGNTSTTSVQVTH